MQTIKKAVNAVAIILLTITSSFGQDPSFSQFFSSPLNINPAMTANINTDWRVISNIRNQWVGLNSPYATGSLSFDSKVLQRKNPNMSEDNFVGLGGMLMFDRSMNGIVKSSYASLDMSYNVTFAEDYNSNKHRLGVGFGAMYGQRSVDFSKLTFQDQFTGSGFNTDLSTGETSLSNMKPFVSANTGLVYNYSNERSNLDIGIAVFNVNKPKQTHLDDENQHLAMRNVAHVNFETYINDRLVLNSNGVYQTQAKASYFSVGSALGYYLDEDAGALLNGGVWYSSRNAIIPYAGIAYKDFQIGLSYDVTVSKLAEAAQLNTLELTLVFRGIRKSDGRIPCPPAPWR